MTKITITADCGDAPKTLLRDLNIAFARADVEAILALMSDDVVWRMVGAGVSEGKMRCVKRWKRWEMWWPAS